VSGHVDGIARIVSVERVGEAIRVGVSVDAEQQRFIAPKGSVCLDGVSLTVNQLISGGFEIMLIPHTLNVTNLKQARVGQELNLEIDLIARYLVHYLEQTGGAGIK
jgi:riboflavin synthase